MNSPPKGWVRGDFLWARPGREVSGIIYVLRKNLGNAVKRNRLKRRLRHLTQIYQPDIPVGSLVILPQKGAAQITFRLLGNEFEQVMAKLKGHG